MRSPLRLALTAVLAIAALLTPVTAWATEPGDTGRAQASDGYTIITLEQAAPTVTTVESPSTGRTGDTAYFEADLTLKGKRIGSLTGQIVVADVTADNAEEEVRQRTLTFALRSGQIVALGASRYRLDPVAGVPVLRAVTTTAIVGGTGRFIGARGQVRTIRHADGTYTQVITLLK